MNRATLQGLALAGVACLLALVPACGNKAGSGRIKVAIITNMTADFWTICEAGAKKGAADFDVDLVFRQPKNNTVSDQMEVVEAVRKLGITGMAVSVINPKEQTADLARIAKEVTLITMDNDAPDSGRLCYVGVNNYEAGKEAGRMAKRAMPNGGTVALFIGNTTSDNSKDRIAGVLTELAGEDVRAAVAEGKFQESYGAYKLHRSQPLTDEGKEDKALSNASDTLEQLKNTPNVALVGLYAYNPKTILEAARSKGLVGKVKIIAFDEDLVTLDGIAKGEIEGSITQDPYNYGYESVKWLAHIARGKDKAELPQKPTPYRVILKDGDAGKPAEIQVPVYKASEFADIIREAVKAAK